MACVMLCLWELHIIALRFVWLAAQCFMFLSIAKLFYVDRVVLELCGTKLCCFAFESTGYKLQLITPSEPTLDSSFLKYKNSGFSQSLISSV